MEEKKEIAKKSKNLPFFALEEKKEIAKKSKAKKSKRKPMKVLWQSMPATGRLDLGPPSGVLVSVP